MFMQHVSCQNTSWECLHPTLVSSSCPVSLFHMHTMCSFLRCLKANDSPLCEDVGLLVMGTCR
jgi:hypothetical protein